MLERASKSCFVQIRGPSLRQADLLKQGETDFWGSEFEARSASKTTTHEGLQLNRDSNTGTAC